MAHTGFFNKPYTQQEAKSEVEYSFIPVGGKQFHAAAVAIIDCFNNSTRINEPSLKKILERFFDYYPKFISVQPYLTAHDRMSMLLTGSRKSEIVDCMAFVLRQLAVDEIYANPTNYREVFSKLSSETPESYLRQPDTSIPASGLKALTAALGITITLSYTEHGKELRKLETYEDVSINHPKFEVMLQVQGDQYFPRVKSKADFAFVGQLATPSVEPAHKHSEKTVVLAGIFEKISEDNSRLLLAFEQNKKRLMSMVDAGELTKEQLLTLYVKFLPKSHEPLISQTEFFQQLEHLDRKPIVPEHPENSDKYVAKLLVETLAAWISTKQVDVDRLYDNMESKPSPSL